MSSRHHPCVETHVNASPSASRYHILIIFTLFSLLSSAATSWDGITIAAPPLTGHTYTITTPEELAWVSHESQSRSFAGDTILLKMHLNLANHPWQPIGQNTPFSGVFQGLGHIVYNLNIVDSHPYLGLFGRVSNTGEVKRLAVGQGMIFVKDVNRVGGLVGKNEGKIEMCMTMCQIVAHNSTTIGGLVGENTGTITDCYNTGVVTDAADTIGGLVGYNTGVVHRAYNIGYAVNGGAIVGISTRTDGLNAVFADQKMCRKEVGRGQVSAAVMKENTKDMFHLFADRSVWIECDSLYPQLFAFEQLSFSLLSVAPAYVSELRTERAELLTTSLEVSTDNHVSWYSPNAEVIRVRGSWAVVTRQCQTQQVMLEARRDDYRKEVYTSVKGYDVFTAGRLNSNYRTCLHHPVAFSSHAFAERVAGGKDDDLEHRPYYFRIEKYYLDDSLLPDSTIHTDTLFLSRSTYVGQEDFDKYTCSADTFGRFLYRLYAHDSFCQTEFIKAKGDFIVEVYDEVHAGQIDSKVDTIYGVLPITHSINELNAPTGGDQNYHYQWYMEETHVDYLTGQSSVVSKDDEIKVNRQSVDTAALVYQFDHANEYVFSRLARDSYCMSYQEYLESDGKKKVVVLEQLSAGSLMGTNQVVCDVVDATNLTEQNAPSGGNGRYQYRWLCNGAVLAGADKATLSVADLALSHGATYIFSREVKDDTGLMDWTPSDNPDTLTIRRQFSTGAIAPAETNFCLAEDGSGTCEVKMRNSLSPISDGKITYSYLLSYVKGNDTIALDTLHSNTYELTSTLTPRSYPSLSDEVTLVVERLVSDTICFLQPQKSQGKVIVHFGIDQRLTETLTLCPEQLPYTAEYVYYDGRKETYTFSKDADSRTFVDQSSFGCRRSNTISCKLNYPPQVEVSDLGMLCQTEGSFDISYSIVSGTPTHCSVSFTNDAHNAGLRDTIILLDGTGILNIANDQFASGSFAMTLRFYDANASQTCAPEPHDISFSFAIDGYVHRKFTDVLFVDNNDKNGYPDPLSDHSFVAWQWYKDGKRIDGATEQFYYETGGLNGIYYVVMTDATGHEYRSCDFEARPSTALENVANTADIEVAPQPVNAGEMVNLCLPYLGFLQIYSLDGVVVAAHRVTSLHTTITAPTTPGMYILHLLPNTFDLRPTTYDPLPTTYDPLPTTKLIVK